MVLPRAGAIGEQGLECCEGQSCSALAGVGGHLVLPQGRWHIILENETLSSLLGSEVMASLVFLGRAASLLRVVPPTALFAIQQQSHIPSNLSALLQA